MTARLASSTTGTARVWALTVVLTAVALVLGMLELPGGAPFQAPLVRQLVVGNSWSGMRWSGNSWSGNSWSSSSWSGNSWSGNSWFGGNWTGSSWSGNSWSGGWMTATWN